MKSLDRRGFFSAISCSLASFAMARLIPLRSQRSLTGEVPAPNTGLCWLDVCAPFIIEDAERGLRSEIILTSDTFAGPRGHEDGRDATDYEIYLYDAAGKVIGRDGVTRRMSAPAMRTTVIPISDLIGDTKSFWGGMRIRLRPQCRQAMHASDLFSSAFVR